MYDISFFWIFNELLPKPPKQNPALRPFYVGLIEMKQQKSESEEVISILKAWRTGYHEIVGDDSETAAELNLLYF